VRAICPLPRPPHQSLPDPVGGTRAPMETLTARVYVNDLIPSPTTVKGALVEATFDGYVASAAVVWAASFIGPGGVAYILGDLLQWLATGATVLETVYGFWLEDAGGDMLLVARFDTPYPITGAGSAVLANPQIAIPAVTFPAIC